MSATLYDNPAYASFLSGNVPNSLMASLPSAASPLASPQEAAAANALLNILGPESGTPAGAPAPPGNALDAGRGLSQMGSLAGSLVGGPLGSAVGRGLGAAIGNAVAADRAQEIADVFGLGQVANPGMAAAQGFGRSAASSLAGIAASGLGIPGLSSLASMAARNSIAEPDMRAALEAALERATVDLSIEEAAMMTRAVQEAMAQNMRSEGFGMDPGHALGFNPSTAASDYYDSGMAGMDSGSAAYGGSGFGDSGASNDGGFGGAAQGGLATEDGFKRPKEFNQPAGGGRVIPLAGGGKIAIGPGGGLDDLIPTSINGRRAAALSDGEFVVPADVVSMMGDGSSNAGSRRLYDMVRQIREAKTGTGRQAGPLPAGEILKRVMR